MSFRDLNPEARGAELIADALRRLDALERSIASGRSPDVTYLGRNAWSSAATTGTTELAHSTLTVRVPAGRLVRVSFVYSSAFGSTAADTYVVGIKENVSGAQLSDLPVNLYIGFGGQYLPPALILGYHSTTGNAQTRTFTATAQRTVGSGTLTWRGFLQAEDVGAA